MMKLEPRDIRWCGGNHVETDRLRAILQDHFEFREANMMSERQAFDDLKERFGVLFR